VAKGAGHLLPHLANRTAPGSPWGTLPIDDALSLCDFVEHGNHTAAVMISDADYILVTYMSVAAASCGEDVGETPLTAV